MEIKLIDLLGDFVSLNGQSDWSLGPEINVPHYGFPPVIPSCPGWPICVDPNCGVCR